MAAQRGFFLFELLVAAMLASLIAVWASQALVQRVQDASAQGVAAWMQGIRPAVLAYLEKYGSDLRQAVTAGQLSNQGYLDWSRPALAELKADGLLHAGYPERTRPVDGISIRVLRDGACPGENCRLSAILHSQNPFTKAGDRVDEQMLAQWLLASRGEGGAVHPLRPDVIQGKTFQFANPPAGVEVLRPGTVALAVTHEQLQSADFLRVRDKRDPQFQSSLTAAGHLLLESQEAWQTPCEPEGAVVRDVYQGLLVCKFGLWALSSRSAGAYMTNSVHGCFNAQGRSMANPVTGNCSCPIGHNSFQISEGAGSSPAQGVTRGYLCLN